MDNEKIPYENLYQGNPYGIREEATMVLNSNRASGNNMTAANISQTRTQQNPHNSVYNENNAMGETVNEGVAKEGQPMSLGNIQMYNTAINGGNTGKTYNKRENNTSSSDKKIKDRMGNKRFIIVACSIAAIVVLIALIVAIIYSMATPKKTKDDTNQAAGSVSITDEKEDVYDAAIIYAAFISLVKDPDMGLANGVYNVDDLLAENTLLGVTFEENINGASTKIVFGDLKGSSFSIELKDGEVSVYAGNTIHEYYEVFPSKGAYYKSGKVIDLTDTTEASSSTSTTETTSTTESASTKETSTEETEASTENYGEETWTSLSFNIDGQPYSFPLNYADLEKSGYKCLDSTLEYMLEPNKFTSECSAKNNNSQIMEISFKNRGEEKAPVSECQIHSINIDDEKINFSLENGLKLGVSDNVAINLMGGTPEKEAGLSDTEYVLVYSTTGDETGNEIRVSIKDSVVVGIKITNND